jgi:pyruvate dehydrogenase E1 component alpha subunit
MASVSERVRGRGGPALVECRTYRMSGHSANDKNVYRSKEELIRWKQDDPIEKLKGCLFCMGYLAEDEPEATRERILGEIKAALRKASEARKPDAAELLAYDTMMC